MPIDIWALDDAKQDQLFDLLKEVKIPKIYACGLAVGLKLGQIKTGSLSRTDRMCKYNQLIRIEEEVTNPAPKKSYTSLGDDKVKVKVFDESHEKDLETAINNYIEEKKIKNIVDIKYSVSSSIYAEEQVYCFSALLMYK